MTSTAVTDLPVVSPHKLQGLLCVLLLHTLFPLPDVPYPSFLHLDSSYSPFKTRIREFFCPPCRLFPALSGHHIWARSSLNHVPNWVVITHVRAHLLLQPRALWEQALQYPSFSLLAQTSPPLPFLPPPSLPSPFFLFLNY